jgi:threonylcarbamoyladenosine tRNA methylthiotransferase MtaB
VGVRIAVRSLGCRVNQAEIESLAALLRARGYEIVTDPRDADVQVVNTCTVTRKADADVRRLVSRLRHVNPAAPVVLTGCYAVAEPRLAESLEGVALVVHNVEKARIPDYLPRLHAARLGAAETHKDEPPDEAGSSPTRHPMMHTGELPDPWAPVCALPAAPSICRARAHLKVQDGCNQRCAFCIVPQVRGRSRSLPPDQALEQLETLLKARVPEIVLTGVHLGGYGRDLTPPVCLEDLPCRAARRGCCAGCAARQL